MGGRFEAGYVNRTTNPILNASIGYGVDSTGCRIASMHECPP